MASLPTGKNYLRKLNKLSKLLVNTKQNNTENYIVVRNVSPVYNILMNHLSLWKGCICPQNDNDCDKPQRSLPIKAFHQLLLANIAYRTYVFLKHVFLCFIYTSRNDSNSFVFICNGLHLEYIKHITVCSITRVDPSRLGDVLSWLHRCSFKPIHFLRSCFSFSKESPSNKDKGSKWYDLRENFHLAAIAWSLPSSILQMILLKNQSWSIGRWMHFFPSGPK